MKIFMKGGRWQKVEDGVLGTVHPMTQWGIVGVQKRSQIKASGQSLAYTKTRA